MKYISYSWLTVGSTKELVRYWQERIHSSGDKVLEGYSRQRTNSPRGLDGHARNGDLLHPQR